LIPPLIGFFSKLLVLQSAVQSGYTFLSFIGILVSVISASYYLKIIRLLFTQNQNININEKETIINKDLKLLEINPEYEINIISNLHSFLISITTLIILLFILNPTLILSSTQLLSLNIFKI
jgi:NADH-ubiquinone oxidoreductase chain 2